MAAVLLSACGGSVDTPASIDPPASCTANEVPGIVLMTADSVTGLSVTAMADVVVRDGNYVDNNVVRIPPQYHAAHERAGTYTISVTVAGYRPWTTTGVIVQAARCHVRTATVIARLVH